MITLRQAQHERLAKQDPVTLSQSKGDQQTRRVGIAHLSRTVLVGLLLAGGIATLLYFLPPSIRNPQSPIRNQEALPLPDKPSIVVLPFANLSQDPEQEYFSDGLTEDLTSALSKLSSLFVISRNSASTYKGKPVKAQEVSKELGVQYVLEGSVRKADAGRSEEAIGLIEKGMRLNPRYPVRRTASFSVFRLTFYALRPRSAISSKGRMIMQTIQIDLPDEILLSLKETPEGLSREIRMAAAAKLYELGKLSSGRAAALAGIPRVSFLQALARYGVSILDLTEEELEQDLRNA